MSGSVNEPLAPLEDIDFLEAPFFDPTIIKSMLTQAGVGTAGNLALSFGLGKVKLNPHIKSGAALLVSLGSARYLWDKQRDVAQGLVATSSFVLADWIAHVALNGEPLEIHTEEKSYTLKFVISKPSAAALPASTEKLVEGLDQDDEDEDELFGIGQDEDELLLDSGIGQDEDGLLLDQGEENEGDDIFEAAEIRERRPLLSAADVMERRRELYGSGIGVDVEESRGLRGLVSVL